MPDRSQARKLAAESLAAGDPTGWFERLYVDACGSAEAIPWADLKPNPNLEAWLNSQQPPPKDTPAIVVGCGLGDDAERLSQFGYEVTAFDISSTAIAWCRQRFPQSSVRYEAADALAIPAAWRQKFALVFESYTFQVLPEALREQAIREVVSLVAPAGRLLVICRARDESDARGEMPWPLVRPELDAIRALGLTELRFEDYWDTNEEAPVRRFRAEYGADD